MTVNPDEVVAVGAGDPGRRAQGRGQRRPAARRHAAVAGCRDPGRGDDQGHRAQHDDPGAPHARCSPRRRTTSLRSTSWCCRASANAPPTTGCSAGSGSTDIRPAPRGEPQVEVTFDIDANGILNVSARDRDTGAEQRITISESSNLDQSEVERMVAEAEQNRSADQRLRQEVDARNELDALAYQVERRLDRARRLRPRARAGPRRDAGRRRPAGGQGGGPDRSGPGAHHRAAELLRGCRPAAGERPASGTEDGRSAVADDDVIDAEFDRS